MKMGLYLRVFLATIAVVGAAQAQAQVLQPTPSSVREIVSEFFADLKAGDSSKAFHFVFRKSESNLGVANIDNLAATAGGIVKSLGPINSYELFKSQYITPHFLRQIYIVYGEVVPLFFTIEFYDSGSGWNVVSAQLYTYDNAKSNGSLDDAVSTDNKAEATHSTGK